MNWQKSPPNAPIIVVLDNPFGRFNFISTRATFYCSSPVALAYETEQFGRIVRTNIFYIISSPRFRFWSTVSKTFFARLSTTMTSAARCDAVAFLLRGLWLTWSKNRRRERHDYEFVMKGSVLASVDWLDVYGICVEFNYVKSPTTFLVFFGDDGELS